MATAYTYLNDRRYPIQRNYIQCCVIGWIAHTVVSYSNPYVIQEHTYGGYSLHVKFKDDFYQWSSSAWYLEDIIDDIWIQFPTTGDLHYNANVLFQKSYIPVCQVNAIQINQAGDSGCYSYFRLPTAPANHWYQPFPKPSWEYHYREPSATPYPCLPEVPDLPIT